MMNKSDLNKYIELNEQFIKSCFRVCKYLERLEYSYKYIESFRIEDETVIGEGLETWSFGGEEHHTVYFDPELLTYSDMELEAYVNKELAEKAEKERKDKEEKDKWQREKDIKTFNELKEKLGL